MTAMRRKSPGAPGLLLAAFLAAGCGDSVAPEASPEPTPRPPVVPGFERSEVEYYMEVALGTEFGGGSEVVRKWAADVRVRVHGTPGSEDRSELQRVIADLNGILDALRIDVVEEGQTLDLHFAPASTFAQILPEYVSGNLGFFWIRWNARDEITSATVLIDNAGAISQEFRNHLIREELTQALGLPRDSPRYPGSIFFDGSFPAPTGYAPIDSSVLRIHDLAEIPPGSTGATVRRILLGG